MSYSKLSSSIIHSTIWDQPPVVCKVWITMLAMKDRHGEVMASVPGLAHAARVSVDQVQAALEHFKAADPHSRTKEDDGRRIEEIDGGWLILNHAKYRDLQSSEVTAAKSAERVRRHRERKRAEKEREDGMDKPEKVGNAMKRHVTPGNPIQMQIQIQETNPPTPPPADAAGGTSGGRRRKNREERDRDLLVQDIPQEAIDLGKRVKDAWRKKDPDGREIRCELDLLIVRLAEANRHQPRFTWAVLEEAGRAYIAANRQHTRAPQYFFSRELDPKCANKPPFFEWALAAMHKLEARAAAKAAEVVA